MKSSSEMLTYENNTDFKNEERLANLLSEKWKCEMQRNKPLYAFDYIAHRGGIPTAFVELRRRSISFHKYPTVIVSITKFTSAKTHTDVTGLPCLFVCEWTDEIGYINLDCNKDFVLSGEGWNRRNPSHEVEVIGHIKTSDFILLDL